MDNVHIWISMYLNSEKIEKYFHTKMLRLSQNCLEINFYWLKRYCYKNFVLVYLEELPCEQLKDFSYRSFAYSFHVSFYFQIRVEYSIKVPLLRGITVIFNKIFLWFTRINWGFLVQYYELYKTKILFSVLLFCMFSKENTNTFSCY